MVKRIWHKKFLDYMLRIVGDENYKGLPYKYRKNGTISWIANKKSAVGSLRLDWAKKKIRKMGWEEKPGVYSKLMLEVHPTKSKPCQICGRNMSLYYIYLNSSLAKKINIKFNQKFTTNNSIHYVKKVLTEKNFSEDEILDCLCDLFKFSRKKFKSWNEFTRLAEISCREGEKKLLGPGAMSNFPDRFDGFHSYNRCHRSVEDTGRHKENMKSYNKDRRAYEYWSDGNIYAANKFMSSDYFKGLSADHIGPISLGFKHDPLMLQKMKQGDNSSKRDNLRKEDIEMLIGIEQKYRNFIVVSWFAERIWRFIKGVYSGTDNLDELRNSLKSNLRYFMFIVREIKHCAKKNGKNFLIKNLLKPKFKYFEYSYKFNEYGEITLRKKRKANDLARKEIDRYIRIAFDSVEDFYSKENRKTETIFYESEKQKVKKLINEIESGNFDSADILLKKIVEEIEERIILEFKSKIKKR